MHSETEPGAICTPGSDRSRPSLLCVGNDEALLSYRCKVLTQAGFQVIGARPKPEQAQQFSSLCRLHGPGMVIACHTLSTEQRIELAKEVRDASPGIKLLALTNGSLTPKESAGYDVLLDSLDGPAALIHQVHCHV